MKTLSLALIGFGFIGLTTAIAPTTAKAQGVYYSGPGVEVQIRERPYYRRHTRSNRYYRDQYYAGPYAYQYDRGYYGSRGYSGYSGYSGYGINPPSTY